MNTNNYNNFFVFITILGFTFMFSCREAFVFARKECTTAVPYEFNIPCEILPHQHIFYVGDTITVNFDFEANLIDATENISYNMKDFKNFDLAVRLIQLKKDEKKNPFFFTFSDTCCTQSSRLVVDYDFEFRDNKNDAGIVIYPVYNEISHTFTAKISYILQQKGTYYFRIVNQNDRESSKSFPNQCGLRPIDFTVSQKNDGNFDLTKYLIFPDGQPDLIDEHGIIAYKKEAGFSFEVKEK